MANLKEREKRRANRMRKNKTALMKAQDQSEIILDDDEDETDGQVDSPVEEKSLIEKDMYSEAVPMAGPTSWEDLDAYEEAREQAEKVREVSWNVQDLVSNIAYSAMPAEEKASAIKKVGDGFGKRLKNISKVEKKLNMDLLEIQVILAKDARQTPLVEKVGNWIAHKTLLPETTYPLDSKSNVRYSLKKIAHDMEAGDTISIALLPDIKEAAKKFGIGNPGNGSSAVVVEKDKSGQWRAVMWPSNNFIDFDGDIISDTAHREYVDWVNKNMDVAPVFMCHHIPGTLRKHRVDYVGYDSGFLLMSAPLEEKEAAGLLRAQLLTDLGMSHGTFVIERNQKDNRVIEKYRMVEVSDLPLENAANPFTDLETLKKEAAMDTRQYLVSVLGEEEADKYLSKMEQKQKSLREAGIEEKAKTESVPEKVETKANEAPAPITNIDLIVEAVKKELDVDGLQEFLTQLSEDSKKVPILEALVKELSKNQDEALAEIIDPPVAKVMIWQQNRKSQNKETVLKDEDPADVKLKKAKPEVHWLNQMTNTEPVAAQ